MANDLPFPALTWMETQDDDAVVVRILGGTKLELWGPELEPLEEELRLAISDRIERMHPRLIENLHAPGDHESQGLVVAGALVIYGKGELLRPIELQALVSRRNGWTTVWVPRLGMRLWFDQEETAIEEAARVVSETLTAKEPAERLTYRVREESWKVLPVEATPAPLRLFSGPHGNREELPEPAPEREAAETQGAPKPPPTPTLEGAATALHDLASSERIPRAFEVDELVDQLLNLLKTSKAPIALVGPRGVGKSAVANELAFRLHKEQPKRGLWFADAGRLVAGQGGFGGWQEQVLDITGELIVSEGVWFLGDLLPLLDAGKHAFSDQNVAQMLKPALGSGQIRALGEATDTDWAQLELRNPGFANLFSVVRVEEPPIATTVAIVEKVSASLDNRVEIQRSAQQAAVQLASRYGQRASLVGTSLQLLRRAVASVVSEGADRPTLDRTRLVQHVCEETGLPPFLVRDDLAMDPAMVHAHFAARILGQPSVLGTMTNLVATIKAGLGDDSRPLGSYLFIGPTGVGKTETVKALAGLLYGRDDRVIRLDMGEYQGSDCIDRLLGASDHEGLVAKVARVPFAIVLLDEIEKAHSAVFDLLLGVLGEARLTDRNGKTADFRNAVILMTSNLGVDTFRRPSGFGVDLASALDSHLHTAVKQFFRPEFLGRIDGIVPFEPLGPEPISAIATRELTKLRKRHGLRANARVLRLDDEVEAWLTARGVDIRYGARPLKRTIERHLVAPIARALSATKHAHQGVEVAVDGERLRVRLGEAKGEAAQHPLRDELDTLSLARHRLQQWGKTESLRTLQRTVQLVDRLADTKAFWRDEKAARDRLGAVESARTISEEHARLLEHAEALEDLCLEAWAGHSEASPELSDEVETLKSEVEAFQWGLASHGLSRPNECTVWFSGADADLRHLEPLLVAYCALAESSGATMHLWAGRGNGLNKLSEKPVESAAEARTQLRSASAKQGTVRINLVGPHITTKMLPEAGRIDLRTTIYTGSVILKVKPGKNRTEPEPVEKRQRVVNLAQREVRDHVLGKVTGLGEFSAVLRASIEERMLSRLLGRGTEVLW